VAGRVLPTERARAEIDELFASDQPLAEVLEDVARLSVRLLLQTALEAEVDAFLGRTRYQRRTDEHRAGSRNGWQPPTAVKTTMGPVELQRPKLRGTDQAFCSRLFGAGVTRTNALESLVISGWVRGLSDRDVEAALAEVLGAEAALSRSTVSRICQRIKDEFQGWRTRDLSGLRLDYLFLDASHFKMHPGAPAEPVLAAWGIDTDGKPVFVGLAPASSESTDAWDDFLADLVGRGLGPPLLGISDGAAGLISAFEQHFRTSLRQRCLVHRSRKESRCRCAGVRGGGRGRHQGQESRGGAVAGWCRCGGVPGLFEERAGLADGVADRGPADLEQVGEDVHRAQSALVEDGHKDAFAVAGLLVEDAAAGAGLTRATAPLIAEALGLGSLPGCEPFGELLQVGAADSGQSRVGQLLDDLGSRGRVSVSRNARRAWAVGKRTGAAPKVWPWSSRASRVWVTVSPMQVAVTSKRSASTFMEHTCRW
jgi:hypothetical protein